MRTLAALLFLMSSTPALAQSGGEDEPICADRPGLGSPPCATPVGRVVVELGLGSWTLDREDGQRSDTVTVGETLIRAGVADGLEVQLGWTAFGHVRERAAMGVDRQSGVGDVSVALLKTIVEGDTLELSAIGRVTAPVGGEAIGAGDWSFDLVAPAGIALSDTLSLDLTPIVSAAADEDRSGRHFVGGSVVGLRTDIGDTALASLEIAAFHDDDPAGATTPLQLGLSAAWRPNPDLQLDAGANVGLNSDADDLELYIGISRRF
jgi:hypothetical protein